MQDLFIFDEVNQLYAALAAATCQVLEQQLKQGSEPLTMAISGGNTPAGLMQAWLDHHRDSPLWSKLSIYWVDERHVPWTHIESNYGNALPYFLELGMTENQLFPMPVSNAPSVDAQTYQMVISKLEKQRGSGNSLFDLTLLGLGPDGHVASLFPGSDHTLDRAYCKATRRPETGQARISLTLKALNQSKFCVYMASGSAKAEIIARVYRKRDSAYPASLVDPPQPVVWFLDQQASALI